MLYMWVDASIPRSHGYKKKMVILPVTQLPAFQGNHEEQPETQGEKIPHI